MAGLGARTAISWAAWTGLWGAISAPARIPTPRPAASIPVKAPASRGPRRPASPSAGLEGRRGPHRATDLGQRRGQRPPTAQAVALVAGQRRVRRTGHRAGVTVPSAPRLGADAALLDQGQSAMPAVVRAARVQRAAARAGPGGARLLELQQPLGLGQVAPPPPGARRRGPPGPRAGNGHGWPSRRRSRRDPTAARRSARPAPRAAWRSSLASSAPQLPGGPGLGRRWWRRLGEADAAQAADTSPSRACPDRGREPDRCRRRRPRAHLQQPMQVAGGAAAGLLVVVGGRRAPGADTATGSLDDAFS